MELNSEVCERARLSRDARFDGRFFIGVKTTGVYCRPVCPVKAPRSENVSYFVSAAAAAEAGFRPCLRCRPESAPGTPAWMGTSTTVSRGLRLITDGALDEGNVESMADRLGVSSRHLSRLFVEHLGASPISVAQTRRLHFAKQLIDDTDLTMANVALAAGYNSIRRFNTHFRSVYGRPPSAIRKVRKSSSAQAGFEFYLPYRPPYDWHHLIGFLSKRAIPGVESVDEDSYSRSIEVDGEPGSFCVSRVSDRHALRCRIQLSRPRALMNVVERIKRIFDLLADPVEIQHCLGTDARLGKLARRNPGLRVPGTWDGFELAVRAIIGQQVSVAGARTVAGRLVKNYGGRLSGFDLESLFPSPQALSRLDTGGLSMPKGRAQAIKDLALGVENGDVSFNSDNDSAGLRQQLKSIKGIGEWTAQYVAMRALNDPDAFMCSDLVLLNNASCLFEETLSARQLLEYSKAWQPWRAYAAMHLWNL